MNWLLDTNVVSETVRPRPNRSVMHWIASQSDETMGVSAVTVAELRVGAEATPSETRRRELAFWIDAAMPNWFGDRILPVTETILIDWIKTADRLASQGRTRASADLLIAATARVHGLTIVTRNLRDFANTGIAVFDPWSGITHDAN